MKVYTKRTWKRRKVVRGLLLVLTIPIWFPLLILTYVGMGADKMLDVLDDWSGSFLDWLIPKLR